MSDLHQYDIRKYDFHTKKFHLLLFVYSLIFGIVIVAPLYGYLRPSNPLVVLSIAIDSIADNETIYNNEGKIEGHIQKK